jgi:negative regulator of sigma-B (phosphoserine phosphatase)
MAKIVESCLEWGSATAALPGQTESGDLHLVVSSAEKAVVAVVDGLGHGPEAAAASRIAIETVKEHLDEPVISMLRRCHECLRVTRGAVISLASFNARDAMMTWVGIGNVAGFLFRADQNLPHETLLLRAGVLGVLLPPLQAAVLPVDPGDVVVFATDGVRTTFAENIVPNTSPRTTAEDILGKYNKGTDDALVLAARYRGSPS